VRAGSSNYCAAISSADFYVEACDAKARIALPANLADGSAAAEDGWRSAAG
jgi:protein ImuA